MGTEAFVLIAVVCGIAGLLLAPHRNRTPVEGFLLGLLLGPLGVLLILAWPGKTEKVS
jgi:hypothetical protein